jgi:transcriptional regulator with XRE-family HTH domain
MEKRNVILTDFGKYLKQLRLAKGITVDQLSMHVGLRPNTIVKIENSRRGAPSEDRLAIWLTALGETKRLAEATRLLKSLKRSRRITYFKNHPMNEHIDRIIDAYEKNELSILDKDALTMVALKSYG